MTYILYETGDDDFFLHITGIFCQRAMEFIRDLYNNHRNKFVQSNINFIDHKKLRRFIKREKRIFNILTPLKCDLFRIPISCPFLKCKTKCKAVLASDQMKIFSQEICDTITSFQDNNFNDKRDRLNFNIIVQNYNTVSVQNIKKISISDKNDPVGFKMSHPVEYMNSYIKGTNKIPRFNNNFVYVRGVNSDFAVFKSKSKIKKLAPCDNLQVI